ncbi:MAG: hypothetical protein IKH77_06965 [Clostridia bacterium]|nr:hypothetical protein [Clostridia bacterium]
MAKLERTIYAPWDELTEAISSGILKGSISSSDEGCSVFTEGGARCSVQVFERYSFLGNNRVSMTVTLFQAEGGPIHLSAITAGGSQAIFIKINTFGEEAFLNKLREVLDEFS